MKKIIPAIILSLFLIFSKTLLADQTMATVNGKPILESHLAIIKKSQGANYNEMSAVNSLIRLRLLAQEAVRMNLDKQPDYQSKKDLIQLELLSNSLISEKLKDFRVTEKDLQQEYDSIKSEMGDKEFSIRHILSTTEKEALDVIKELDKGANFVKLAKEKSTDTFTKENGGLINAWANKLTLPENFRESVLKLEKNKYTLAPVKSNLGWHIVYLEDIRTFIIPSYEKMKPDLNNRMINKEINKFVGTLKDKAKIEILSSQKSK
jgi:peptidyl-prolyl cis-trans isomerase C